MLAVWTECGAEDSSIFLAGSEGLAAGGVPDARGPVIRRGDDALAIQAERGAADTLFMPAEGGEEFVAGGVPDARGLVPRSGDDALAIRAERGTEDGGFMLAKSLGHQVFP